LAQIFGSKIENIKEATKIIYDLGYDGIDLNFGCPDKTIEKQGCGSGMIKTPNLAREVILAAKEIKKDSKRFFSVSVKTRLGYNKIEYET
jgi:tRNA-dihydrouridine synthase